MDHKEEYHDPDYAGTSENVSEEPPSVSEDERIEKIKKIIRREFSNELEVRESEVMTIDQRLATSRRLLHRLRYALVNSYYRDQKLLLNNHQLREEGTKEHTPTELTSALWSGQRRLHPSVRKLLGRRSADLSEIFGVRQPRVTARPDYSAMHKVRNYTVAADSTKSLRPSDKPRKVPRHIEPKVDKVLTLDELTRNKVKHRYRIVIGNTSKYAPASSAVDRSTHKWLLYVTPYRRPGTAAAAAATGTAATDADAGGVVTAVTARLHHSYAPHHTVTLNSPPFHICRRGWGEFTARLELHFPLPELNPPAMVQHDIQLDRRYTGLQTSGAETIVDVWLYSSPEMLKYAYVEDPPPTIHTDTQAVTQTDKPATTQTALIPKQEPPEAEDSWMEFFSKETTELDVDEMIIKPVKAEPVTEEAEMETDTVIKEEPMEFEENLTQDVPTEILSQPQAHEKRIMKYIDPTTGKIYYLEMDRNLDLSTVQEIVINNTKAKISPVKNGVKNTRKKKGVSLLKPEVKNSIRSEQINALKHIENDHCYLGWPDGHSVVEDSVQCQSGDSELLCLQSALSRLCDVRSAVYYLLRHVPLIDARASEPEYQRCFPFVVENEDRYWKMDFAKRRNIEWSRAKLITRLISYQPSLAPHCWRTKQVLTFARLHGLHPARTEPPLTSWSSWGDIHPTSDNNIKELYSCSDINTLSLFQSDSFKSEVTEIDLVDSDEEIDVLGDGRQRDKGRIVQDEVELQPLSPGGRDGEERLRFLFVEKMCADIGIQLRNEDVGNGYSYSAVHAVLLSALRSFAEELLRTALAASRHTHTHTAALHTPPVWRGWSSFRNVINLEHVYQAAGGPPPNTGNTSNATSSTSNSTSTTSNATSTTSTMSGRLQVLCARALAAQRKNTYAL